MDTKTDIHCKKWHCNYDRTTHCHSILGFLL